MSEDEPQSPCVGLCQLDVDRVCRGCGRHIDEIVEWGFVENDRKREIIAAARKRISMIKTGRPPPDAPDDATKKV